MQLQMANVRTARAVARISMHGGAYWYTPQRAIYHRKNVFKIAHFRQSVAGNVVEFSKTIYKLVFERGKIIELFKFFRSFFCC